MENIVKKLGCLILATLWLSVSAHALDPNQPASSFISTHFNTDNGLTGSVVDRMVQTQDGFLWLVTNGIDLARFDGKNFHLFNKPNTWTVAVGPDGDLWVGGLQNLRRIRPSSFNQFTLNETYYHPGSGKENDVTFIRFTRNGVMWIATSGGMFRYEGDRFTPVGPRVLTRYIEEAPDGNLLVINKDGFIELNGSDIVSRPDLATQLGVKENEIFHVIRDSRGNTWYCTAKGVTRETGGRLEHLKTNEHGAFRAYEDSQGTIWIGTKKGLFRATATGLELVAPDMQVRSLYGDRDGNLWVGTNGDGLYKFKERAVRMFTTEDGLPNNVLMTVIGAQDGSVWTGANCGGLSRFDGTRFQTFTEKDGLLNTCVWSIAEDANRDLWIGTWGGGAFRYHNGTFTQYSKDQGLIDERVVSIVAARDGSVWFATHGGLSRLQNGQFRSHTKADGLSAILLMRVFEDRAGGIWVGSGEGVDRLVGDRFEKFTSTPEGLVIPYGDDRDGGFFVYVGEDLVSLRIDKGRVYRISELRALHDMVETDQGELWFRGEAIFRFALGTFVRSRPHDEPLEYESFSKPDGLSVAEANSPGKSMAVSLDGKVWAATAQGLAMIDPRRLPVTNAKPSIYLKDVTIGRNKQPATSEVVLPPGTNHVEIDFAAVEISAPEKIRLQYRLDSVDSEWLDAGPNAKAIYSNIPVGTHALRIRATNRHGIWDRQGVVFSVTQQPYFYQTRWFLALMVALGILLVFFIYRLRVAQISRMLSARFDERLAERTRVARELHDTFLQTVQGSKMVADHALKNSHDHTRMVRAMEQLSTWLARATDEGRAALLSLRSSPTEKNDLAQALHRAVDECGREGNVEISFSINGNFKQIHPVVRDEVYRIGYEAIRNSCAHSSAERLEITLEYTHDLTLAISDNGVGIDAEVVDKGKAGHFGLRGMKERAERIGGKFTLTSSPGSGTLITLVVPGRLAFSDGHVPSWPERLKSILKPN
ncbi:MAG TPA: two-component regulator propeller domain-containing protein [Pyrinomonadaceae bacterium]|nr:two-component regulator propeller domain-containing protein [Pyrinomonadaceae bacterium]